MLEGDGCRPDYEERFLLCVMSPFPNNLRKTENPLEPRVEERGATIGTRTYPLTDLEEPRLSC